MTHQIYVFDVTMRYEAASKKVLMEYLKATCKAWMFQGEKGASNYHHWQLRFSLRTKVRIGTLITAWNAMFGSGFGNISPTSAGSAQLMLGSGMAFYCMKADTRTEGPYSDKDPTPKFVQPRFRNATLRGWQERLWAKIQAHKAEENDRNIILVVDPVGCIGKSWFKGWAKQTQGCISLPCSLQSAKEANQYLCSLPGIEPG